MGYRLIFDLNGPFVVHFQQKTKCEAGKATIYAPKCENHYANLLTDSNDVSLPPKGIYRFKSGTEPDGAGRYKIAKSAAPLLILDNNDLTPSDDCHLKFTVPCPDEIVPLHAEYVWLHQCKAAVWVRGYKKGIVDGLCARSLRFIYDNCPNTPEIEGLSPARRDHSFLPANPGAKWNPVMKGIQPAEYYYIALRFASAPTSALVDDAYHCFYSMRCLFGDKLNWRVDFNHLAEGSNVDPIDRTGRTNPKDCLAALLVTQDW